MYSFFMVRSRVRLRITLTVQPTEHFMWAGVALTNAADSSIAHTPLKKMSSRDREREARQNESEIQKKAMLEVRII